MSEFNERAPILLANLKMNGDATFFQDYISQFEAHSQSEVLAEIVLMLPSPYLYLSTSYQGDVLSFGAQVVSSHDAGAFTGEVSASMLSDFACTYALCGHSERRQYWKESSEQVARQLAQLYKYGVTPVLCVGESREDYEASLTDQIIQQQIEPCLKVLESIPLNQRQLIVAYEPVWAIGTGLTPTVEEVSQVHLMIRRFFKERSCNMSSIRVVYGGSVKPDNLSSLMSDPYIDGALVGGAALDSNTFRNMVHLCQTSYISSN